MGVLKLNNSENSLDYEVQHILYDAVWWLYGQSKFKFTYFLYAIQCKEHVTPQISYNFWK